MTAFLHRILQVRGIWVQLIVVNLPPYKLMLENIWPGGLGGAGIKCVHNFYTFIFIMTFSSIASVLTVNQLLLVVVRLHLQFCTM